MSLQKTFEKYLQTAGTFLLRLRDVRFAGQVLFAIIVILVSWSGVKSIDANYQLQKQIAELEQQNNIQQLENDNLALQNNYYESDQYLELSARQNFGLGAPGETELVVPKNVAMTYIVSAPQQPAPKPETAPPTYQQNIQDWVNFFLHRQS